jgi:hypothetical protein
MNVPNTRQGAVGLRQRRSAGVAQISTYNLPGLQRVARAVQRPAGALRRSPPRIGFDLAPAVEERIPAAGRAAPAVRARTAALVVAGAAVALGAAATLGAGAYAGLLVAGGAALVPRDRDVNIRCLTPGASASGQAAPGAMMTQLGRTRPRGVVLVNAGVLGASCMPLGAADLGGTLPGCRTKTCRVPQAHTEHGRTGTPWSRGSSPT